MTTLKKTEFINKRGKKERRQLEMDGELRAENKSKKHVEEEI